MASSFFKFWEIFGGLCGLLLWPAMSFADSEAKIERSQYLVSQSNETLASLVNLNHHINRWYILTVRSDFLSQQSNAGDRSFRSINIWQKQDQQRQMLTYHIESRSSDQVIQLYKHGLLISSVSQPDKQQQCHLWNDHFDIRTIDYKIYPSTYFSICQGALYIRIKKKSNTKLSLTEWGTDLLRETDFGEGIINSFKPFLVGLSAEVLVEPVENQVLSFDKLPIVIKYSDGPQVIAQRSTQKAAVHKLGISLKKNDSSAMTLGKWYEARMHEGVYVSLFTPEQVPDAIMNDSDSKRVRTLNKKERNMLVYVTAYDLSRYSIHYAVGTEEPPINKKTEDTHNESLVPVGHIPPYELTDSISVFIGGFKDHHSTFRAGPHKGKKYGFIQNGVELQKMAPGLASILVDQSGAVSIERWPEDLEKQRGLRRKVVSARQNGVMLLEDGRPGELVSHWRHGNWSASALGVGTSLRVGVCMQESFDDRRPYLIYMAFTSATPSAMARVMQAYQCKNGMHLDMNAYIYMHNAIFQIDRDNNLEVEYLNTEMHYPPGTRWHRFIVDNNSRDFFYVKKR